MLISSSLQVMAVLLRKPLRQRQFVHEDGVMLLTCANCGMLYRGGVGLFIVDAERLGDKLLAWLYRAPHVLTQSFRVQRSCGGDMRNKSRRR